MHSTFARTSGLSLASLNDKGAGFLTRDQLQRQAPSVFAEAPHFSRSERYKFFPTIQVVDALTAQGWYVTQAKQGKARDLTRAGVQRHLVRMRHPDMNTLVDGNVPELVMLNSHDGTSAFQLMCGVFRFVCSNGLIVASAGTDIIKVPHTRDTISRVVEASFTVAQNAPKVLGSVESMRAVQLERPEQLALASGALTLRWEPGQAPVSAETLLSARRWEDSDRNDLWTTLNRVQENITQGGQRGFNATGRRTRTRSLTSVAEDTKINRALWTMAEELRKAKSNP